MNIAAAAPTRQQDASPSRIPHAQQLHDPVYALADMDKRLAERLSRNAEQVSPSKIPKITQPAALMPTARLASHQNCTHDSEQQLLQPAASNKVSPGKIAQGTLPRLHPARTQQPKQAQTIQQDRLEPWEYSSQPQQQPLQQQPQQQKKLPAAVKAPLQQQSQVASFRRQQQQSPGKQSILQGGSQHKLDHARAAAAANNGWLASRKMHEFLLSQQRKKEVYWLSKYGRVLGPAAPDSLGKPCPNPSSLFRHPAASHTAVGSNLRSSRSSSPLKLPLLNNNRSQASIAAESSEQSACRQQGYGHLHAHDEEESSRLTPRGQIHYPTAQGPNAATEDDKQHPAAVLEQTRMQQQTGQQVEQQQQQLSDVHDEEAFEQVKAKITLASVPRLSVTTHLSKPALPAVAAGAAPPVAASDGLSAHGPGTSDRGTAHRQLPCRDLEAELQVLKAIKAREDAQDKLRACCTRLGAAVGADNAASMLLASDPLGRLFYRLVSALRLKTLDVIEAHAAWQRKVSGPFEPFTYRGKPYLTHMGEGLSFLDAAPWLCGRFIRCRAVEDSLLVELTPDGVPIDDVTSFDIKRGPCHFSPEALRIRMARKVLAAAGVQAPPETADSMAAALQQHHQHQRHQEQELRQEISSQLLQQTPQQKQQQHAAAVSAVTAALDILQHSGANDTVTCSEQQSATDRDADEHDASVGGSGVQPPHAYQLTGGTYLNQEQDHQLCDVASNHQEQQQEQLQQQQQAHQAPQQQQSRQQYQHADSCVIDELVDDLVNELGSVCPQTTQSTQQQQQNQQAGAIQAASSVQQPTMPAVTPAAVTGNDLVIEEMIDALMGSLEVACVERYPAFGFSCSDWVIDDLLHGLMTEVAGCC